MAESCGPDLHALTELLGGPHRLGYLLGLGQQLILALDVGVQGIRELLHRILVHLHIVRRNGADGVQQIAQILHQIVHRAGQILCLQLNVAQHIAVHLGHVA